MAPGQIIGYRRVSSLDQNLDRQLAGVEVHKTFEDKASGKDTNRPALREALEYARTGDTLVVHSIDRLARSMADLLGLLKELNGRGVTIQFVKENLTFTGEPSPMQELQLHMLAAFAQFERSLIRERQAEGIAAAKLKNVYRGRKPSLTAEQVDQIKARVQAGENKSKLAQEFKISRQTLYAALAGK